jgi:hypothetical protein
MGHVAEQGPCIGDDLVRGLALDVANKSDSTRLTGHERSGQRRLKSYRLEGRRALGGRER